MTHSVIGPVCAPGLHVMTLNLRRRVPHLRRGHPDRWDRRGPLIHDLLRRERPAVLAVQEALPEQLEAVADALGDRWTVLGRGRGRDGGDEASALLVDTGRLEIVGWEQLALSSTPDSPGSRSWASAFARVAVCADLRDRVTRSHWRFVSTHLDNISPLARLRSAQMLAGDVVPRTVVMGDMNTGIGSAPFRAFSAAGLTDAWADARAHLSPEWGTHPGYRSPRAGRRIDWILVGAAVTVETIAIGGGRGPGPGFSDHEPVQAVLVARQEGSE